MANRPTAWHDTIVSQFLGGGGSQLIKTLQGTMDETDLKGATMTRTLVRLNLTFSATTPVDSVQRLSFGVGVGSREAVLASIVPDPETDAEEPTRGWVWRDAVAVVQDNIVLHPSVRVVADVRSGRKLEGGLPYLVVTNEDVSGTSDSVQVHGLIRVLCYH